MALYVFWRDANGVVRAAVYLTFFQGKSLSTAHMSQSYIAMPCTRCSLAISGPFRINRLPLKGSNSP